MACWHLSCFPYHHKQECENEYVPCINVTVGAGAVIETLTALSPVASTTNPVVLPLSGITVGGTTSSSLSAAFTANGHCNEFLVDQNKHDCIAQVTGTTTYIVSLSSSAAVLSVSVSGIPTTLGLVAVQADFAASGVLSTVSFCISAPEFAEPECGHQVSGLATLSLYPQVPSGSPAVGTSSSAITSDIKASGSNIIVTFFNVALPSSIFAAAGSSVLGTVSSAVGTIAASIAVPAISAQLQASLHLDVTYITDHDE